MKINKHWALDADLIPWKGYAYGEASRAQYDSVSIYHEPRDKEFIPVVLRDCDIVSESNWLPKEFIRGLEKCLLAMDDFVFHEREHFYILALDQNEVKWGCRTFTRKQVNELIKLVKWHYGI